MRSRAAGTTAKTLGLVALLFLLAAGCTDDAGDDGVGSAATDDGTAGTSTADDAEPEAGGELVMVLNAESTGYNPIVDRFAIQGHYVASTLFDPLARIDENGDLVPHLAESIESNDDFTAWTITIPEGITFHDGSPLTAEVVAGNLQARAANPLTGGVQLGLVDEIEAVDDRTVEVRMKEPWSVFDYMLAQQIGYVVSQSMLDGGTDLFGTGPFTIADRVIDEKVVVEANPDYWQEGLPYLDRLEFRIITDPRSMEASLQAGDIDAGITIAPGLIADLRDSDFTVVEDAAADENLIVMNADAPPLDDIRVRRALAMATDRQVINETVFSGVLPDATGPFSEGEPWYDPDDGYPVFDADEAARLVEEYTEETGDPVKVTLTQISSPIGRELSQVLSEQWSAVGIDVEVVEMEQSGFISELVGGSLQLANFQNFGYADPDFMNLFLHSRHADPANGAQINFSRTRSDDLDAALDLGRRSGDHTERVGAYQDMVRALNEELGYLWLNHRLAGIVAEPNVGGLDSAEAVGFGRVDEKSWISGLWLDQSDD